MVGDWRNCMFNFKNHLMKKYFYLFIIPVFLLASDLLNAQAYCTQPSSYRYTSNANGTWGSTWTVNASAPANTYLITHRITYGASLKPASGAVIVIKDGGELISNQIETDNGGVTFILDGAKLTVTQNVELKNSSDRICSNNSCITIGEDFQSLSGSQMYFADSGIRVGENLQTNSTVTGSNYKIWVREDFQNTSGWGSAGVTSWYAGGQNPSGSGWPAESPSTMLPCAGVGILINAVDDTAPAPINGTTGGNTGINVYINDTLGANPATSSNVTLTSTPTAQLSINPSTGAVTVASGTAPGTYTINYTICETANPSNCDTATVTVTVFGPCAISATNPDSDGDGIADDCDLDDDNDGILDTAECSNTINDMFAVYGAGGLIDIAPSDFGLALGVRNQNVTADLSSKFGYPANSGAVIISINNASVHPTANAWWTKNGEQPSVWNVSGKMSAFVLMSQNPEYYGQDSKTIHIFDGATVIPITAPGLANQTAVPGTWSVTETPTSKTLSNMQPEQTSIVNNPAATGSGNWRYANMNFGAKTFGFSTTTKYANPTYAVMMYLECDTDGDGIPNRLDLDSDADGCPDALEGGADILPSGLMTAGGTLTGGSTTVNQNICTTCVSTGGSNIGLPQITTPPSGYSNTTGQTVGDSQNATVNSCPSIVCTSESSMLNTSSVSATQSGGNGQQAFVIDNDVTAANYWQSSAAAQSLTIDYGQSYTLNGMTYYPSTTGNKVLGYTIQTSTDNITFTTVATGTFPDYTTSNLAAKGIPNTVRFANPVNARYLRMIVADSGKRVAEIVPLVCGLTPIDMTCERVPLISSGTNATATGKKAVRNLDNNWTVTHFNGGTANPSTSTYNYTSIANAVFHPAIVVGRAVVTPGNPNQTWATSPFGNAEWISATQNGFDIDGPASGASTLPNTYFYKYKFNIANPLLVNSLKLRLDYYVDNQIVRVYVNGVDQGINTTDFLGYANGHEKSTFITNNFQAGVNELVVQMYSEPHYAGLLVQGIESCYCVKDPIPGTPQGYTKVGITNQNKQEAWPGNIPNGHIALESKNNGFVITRVNHVSTVPAPSDSIADPKEGMVVYDIVDKCVKLFNGTNWTCIQRTCNDSL